jgi:hypothetical protein
MLDPYTDVIVPDLVDNPQEARQAGELFKRENVDLVLVFPFGSTPSIRWCQRSRICRCPFACSTRTRRESHQYVSASAANDCSKGILARDSKGPYPSLLWKLGMMAKIEFGAGQGVPVDSQ